MAAVQNKKPGFFPEARLFLYWVVGRVIYDGRL
jgi:hypothetical protein